MRHVLLPALGVLAAGLAGCVSVLPEPETPLALIVLPADRAAAPGSPLRADISVYPPDASRALGGVDMPVADGSQLVYLPRVRWADAAPRLMQGAVLDALARAEGSGSAAPAQLGARADYDLRWRIVELHVGREGGDAVCTVEATLLQPQTRRILAQDRFTVRQPAPDRDPRARAEALSLAAQGAADRVAGFVVRAAEPPPAGS